MKKNKKIIHYSKNSYFDSGRGMTPLKLTGIIVAVLVLLFIGWSSYEPVMNFLEDFKKNISKENQSSHIVNQSSESGETSNDNTLEQSYYSSSEESSLEEKEKVLDKSIYIPINYLTDFDTAFTYFNEKQKTVGEAQSITIYMKDDLGNIYLPVKNEIAVKNKAVFKDSEKIAEIMAKFKEKGIKINGLISTFKDPKAPFNNTKCQIMYSGSEIAWVDDDPQKGGKQWLNPYSPYSAEYVIDIAKECYALGVDKIIFDNVNFPKGYSLEMASYAYMNGRTRQEALFDFTQTVEKTFDKDKFVFMVHAENAIYPNDMIYGGNHLSAFKNNVMLVISPNKIDKDFTFAGQNYKAGGSIEDYIKIFKEHYPDIFADENMALAFYSDEAKKENYNNMSDLLIL